MRRLSGDLAITFRHVQSDYHFTWDARVFGLFMLVCCMLFNCYLMLFVILLYLRLGTSLEWFAPVDVMNIMNLSEGWRGLFDIAS